MRRPIRFLPLLLVLATIAVTLTQSGCTFFQLAGAMAENYERTKKIEVLARYEGLQDSTVAVIVQADPSMLYEYASAPGTIAANVSNRIATNVPGVAVLDYRIVMQWQYNTPGWSGMPFGEIAEELGVERLVIVDIYEYRLNPPGNRWLWEGVAAANVGVIERDGLDPDLYTENFPVTAEFPGITGLGVESASAEQVQLGLLAKFVEQIAWLFYDHIEDKYPDG